MPMYDYECLVCHNEDEAFAKLADKENLKCNKCGGSVKTLITQKSGFRFYEGFDEHLGAYVTGPKQRADIMKKKGIEELGKAEANRANHFAPKKKKVSAYERVHQAAHKVWEKKKNWNPEWSKFMGV